MQVNYLIARQTLLEWFRSCEIGIETSEISIFISDTEPITIEQLVSVLLEKNFQLETSAGSFDYASELYFSYSEIIFHVQIMYFNKVSSRFWVGSWWKTGSIIRSLTYPQTKFSLIKYQNLELLVPIDINGWLSEEFSQNFPSISLKTWDTWTSPNNALRDTNTIYSVSELEGKSIVVTPNLCNHKKK